MQLPQPPAGQARTPLSCHVALDRNRSCCCPVVAPYPTRKRQRLRDFDYAAPGFYFVTICTADRHACLHGELAAVVRSEIGAIATRFPGASICEQVLMPDHVHVILQLNGATVPLPRIIQAFKSLPTMRADLLSHMSGNRLWQRGYHDRVIRNDEELLALRQNIRNNPLAAEAGRGRDAGRAGSAPASSTPSTSITRQG